ncbi:hypothetical protein BAC1_01162 [uncultured bacterium]|nr:hypothetical protein BAC1_01162 [uncultured bacterium]
MIKVNRVMAESFILQDRTRRDTGRVEDGLGAGDRVTISEEGKKRRVMGHVMASLNAPEHGKKA